MAVFLNKFDVILTLHRR